MRSAVLKYCCAPIYKLLCYIANLGIPSASMVFQSDVSKRHSALDVNSNSYIVTLVHSLLLLADGEKYMQITTEMTPLKAPFYAA